MFDSSTTAHFSGNLGRLVTIDATESYLRLMSPLPDIRPDQRKLNTTRQTFKLHQIAALLQTTLDLETLLRHFSRQVGDVVAHSGLVFMLQDHELEVSLGRNAKHSCTFSISLEKRVLGHIILSRGKPFLEREIKHLEYLTCALVYPLRNALDHRNALQASLTDPLTGIYNRSVVEDTLRREIRLARRYRNPFSILLFDIDSFKQVNDLFGHEQGDTVIKLVTRCVSRSLRETDVFARYGGDEFVILLTNTGRTGANTLAQHILERTHRKDCLSFENTVVTLSIGVATMIPGEDDKALLARADEAMYRAKGRGGDRIQFAR